MRVKCSASATSSTWPAGGPPPVGGRSRVARATRRSPNRRRPVNWLAMEQESTKRGLLQGLMQRLAALASGRARASSPPPADSDRTLDPLAVLEQVQAGRRPDYCLYIGPTKVKPV